MGGEAVNSAVNAKAGQGESARYYLPTDSGDSPIEPGMDYISIEATSWFINQDSNWFNKWSASGSISIKLDDADRYNVALGVFELDNGAKIAPVFEKAVLPQRAFRGGSIEVEVSLTGFEKATTLLKLLKSASRASLDIVAGMVQAAEATGPLKVLTAAGSELVSGVQDVLGESGPGRQPFFPAGALSFTLSPEDLRADELYVLLHRGSPLSLNQLKVSEQGGRAAVLDGGISLQDGVWMLLKFSKSQRYLGYRQWQDKQDDLKDEISNLRQDVRLGVMTAPQALKQLARGSESKRTLFDRFVEVRTLIQSDSTITGRDATVRITALTDLVTDLRDELKSGTVSGKGLPKPATRTPDSTARRGLARNAELVARARKMEPEQSKAWITMAAPLDAVASESRMLRAR